ncbi:MAG: efflux RND transporter periplasmic adaptor subunit [Bacteroidales bacterium]
MRNRFVRPIFNRWVLTALGVAAVAGGVTAYYKLQPSKLSGIPVAKVVAGEFLDTVQLRADVKPVKSIALNAPSTTMAFDLRIVRLARNGATVKQGDVVLQFDTTQMMRTLEEKRSELKRTEAEIERARAQARITEEQNVTEQTRAGYDVQRAKLDTGAKDLLSPVEAQEKELALDNAQEKLRATNQKVTSGRTAASADLQSVEQKRDKALAEVQEAERNLQGMTVKAPVTGIIALGQNWRAGGNFNSPPDFREGDRVWPGAQIAELPDMATAFVDARVDEAERGRLQVGQAVLVRVDAIPDKELTGTVSEISTLAAPDFSSYPPVRSFSVIVKLAQIDPRLRPGMSATVRIVVDRVPKTTLVPAAGVFTKGGRSVVYVIAGNGFEERVIEIARRNTEQVAVARGLSPGAQIALKDPLAVAAEGAKK